MKMPDIRINFNGYTCYYSELELYLKSIDWKRVQEDEVLYYSSTSKFVTYDFRVFHIHDEIIEMIAIPE